MLAINSLRSVPRALACWFGAAGTNEAPSARILLFQGTPRSDAAALERQLRWLKRHFQVVPLRNLVSAAAGASGGVDRKVALTFDDGLRSNVEVAYPLLHRLALPATFFVCPGLIDRAKWLWTHEARRRLARLDPALCGELAKECGAPADIEMFVEWMKGLDLDPRRRVEQRIHEATPRFAPTPSEGDAFDLAGWPELKRLDPALVTIGSHSLTHPILTSIPSAELETEVRESRRQLESSLQRPVELFAYPNGNANAAVEACVRRHYRAAVTAARGWVRRNADPVRLPRLFAPQGVLRLARRI
jgi:peptidoglycan/xylan/chitin deacetylase (PgdA/CDA1 family)